MGSGIVAVEASPIQAFETVPAKGSRTALTCLPVPTFKMSKFLFFLYVEAAASPDRSLRVSSGAAKLSRSRMSRERHLGSVITAHAVYAAPRRS